MNLTKKKIKTLRSEGNYLKPELWIGKDGITNGSFESLENSFSTKELVKIRLLDNSGLNIKETSDHLSKGTQSEIIQIIGNTILLFKPLKK
jgi:RNA-binding protein